jgi:hypothetical protein
MTKVAKNLIATGAPATPANVDYQRAYFALMGFFQLDLVLTESIPQVVEHLETNNPAGFRRLATIVYANPEIRNPDVMKKIIIELIMCRLVDHFKVYLCDLLENIFAIRPQLLVLTEKERKQIAKRYQTTSEDELRTAAIIDTVDYFSERSIADYCEYFRDKIGIDLGLANEKISAINECFAVRNVIVHTRGRANRRFLQRTGRTDLKIGDIVDFTTQDCQRWSTAMGDIAEAIDRRVLDSIGREEFLHHFESFYQDFLSRQKKGRGASHVP